jgi:LemA protein
VSVVLWIVLGVVALVLLAGIISYNRFVAQRNLIRNAFANIDTELRRRYDLIPNLVETVRGYAAHERETLEAVIQARNAAAATAGQSPEAQAAAEGPFVAALRQLFAVAEAYPTLRANENFLALQTELANTEDRLQASRRFYNGNVQDYNRRVESFPSNIIAGMFKFTQEQFFEIEEAIRTAGPPQVSFGGQAGGAPPATPTPPAVPPAVPPAAPPAVPPAPPPVAPPAVPPAVPPPGAPPTP